MILARIQTHQEITLSRIETDFDLSLDVSHQSLRQLVCVCEGDFNPTAVTLRTNEINAWRYQPATGDSPALLSIQFPEPLEGSGIPLHIRGLSPFPGRSIWRCAGIRPQGAVIPGESLVLHVGAELGLEDWSPGGFELSRTSTDKTGGFILSLQSGTRAIQEGTGKRMESNAGEKGKGGTAGAAKLAVSLRPSARLRLQPAIYHVRQYSAWRVEAGGVSRGTWKRPRAKKQSSPSVLSSGRSQARG
jgi:hypothetical protein